MGRGEEIGGEQVLQYDFASLKAATNYFSTGNKLGEGGFGVVYKVSIYTTFITFIQSKNLLMAHPDLAKYILI